MSLDKPDEPDLPVLLSTENGGKVEVMRFLAKHGLPQNFVTQGGAKDADEVTNFC